MTEKKIDATFISVDVCQLSFFSLLISTLNNEDEKHLTQLLNINRSSRCTKERGKKPKLTIIFDPLQCAIATGSPFCFFFSSIYKTLLFFSLVRSLYVCLRVRNRSYTVWCSDEQLFFYLFSSSQQPQKIWYLFCLFNVLSRNEYVTKYKATKENMYIKTKSSIVYVMSLLGLCYIYINIYVYMYVHPFWGVFIQAS